MSKIIHTKRDLRPISTASDIRLRFTRAAARAVIGCLIPISDAHGLPFELAAKNPQAETAHVFGSVDQHTGLKPRDMDGDIYRNRQGTADDLEHASFEGTTATIACLKQVSSQRQS